LREYELVVILSPDVPEEEVPASIDRINDFITSKGGSVIQVDRWGKRRLAYPINHFKEGNYMLTKFKIEPASTTELEANLRISEKVLRHMLVRLGD
jgi:small subunit ribosomal protein S6